MYAVFGLGNPEKRYEKTRHNIGFDVLDSLAKRNDILVKTRRHRALCGVGTIGENKVVLVKPQTYMNLSGESVRSVVDFYGLDPRHDIIVISDDVDLPTGKIRVRARGSAGGHNGLKNIILHLGTQDFMRVRVGVGKPNGDMVSHVIGKFSKDDRKVVDEGIDLAALAVETIISEGVEKAMNEYNGARG